MGLLWRLRRAAWGGRAAACCHRARLPPAACLWPARCRAQVGVGIAKLGNAGITGDGWLLVRYDRPVTVAGRILAAPTFTFFEDFTLNFKWAGPASGGSTPLGSALPRGQPGAAAAAASGGGVCSGRQAPGRAPARLAPCLRAGT